jgi:FAD synthase
MDLYGQEMSVRFLERLRGDQVFATREELSRQIAIDVLRARDAVKAAAQTVEDSQVS